MPAVIAGARPSGNPVPYADWMSERGFSATKAAELARLPNGPATYLVGRRRYADEALLTAWWAAVARGELKISISSLRELRAAAVPNEAIREGKRRAREAREREAVGA